MKEVKKCSISGIAFTLDADAYQILDRYLETLKTTCKNSDDGREIVADIEARIAELILSAQDNTRVVEKPLIDNIIAQMGSVHDISDTITDTTTNASYDTERIPRRLYRDVENAKLGGVCAGIAKYFDTDPVWVRVGMFVPILLTTFSWVPLMWWLGPLMGNIFGLIVISYLVMWFAVPVARSPRQKLEMNGEKITVQSIKETAAANREVDSKAKPAVANAVYAFGQVVLILMKIFAGMIVFGLILLAIALFVSLFAVSITGTEYIHGFMAEMGVWFPILVIVSVLMPVMLLVYVLMCLIASRKPSGKVVLISFIIWICIAIATSISGFRGITNGGVESVMNVFDDDHIMNEPVLIDIDSTYEDSMELIDEDSLESFELKVNDKKIIDVKVDGQKITTVIDGH